MAESQNDRVIVSAVLSMARELGLDVVAEGVETIEQLDFLRDKGCPYVQVITSAGRCRRRISSMR